MSELFVKDTKSILDMLRKEVPLQIKMSALFVASIPDKRKNMEKAISHFEEKLKGDTDDLQTQATIERLKKELEKGEDSVSTDSNENLFSEENLRKRLHVIFGAYLAYLEDNDAEGFKKAMAIIEKGISDSEKILSRARKSLGINSSNAQSDKSMEKAVAIRATEFFAPVDKLSNTLFDTRKNPAFYEKPEVLLKVGAKGGKPVTSLVSINVDKLEGVTLSNGVMVEPYNRSVHNAVVSLYVAGNTHFTPRMIYQAMNGGKREHKPPEQANEDIMASMRKLMYTRVSIDATKEAKAFGFKTLKIEGYTLLPVILTTAEINGQVVECFKFMYEPPLYTYASRKKQISRCNINLLAVDLRMTPENIVIRDYLLEQITSIQSKKGKLQNIIRYDTLCEYLGIDAPNENALRQRKSDVRTKVRTILNTWVKAGFIEGYEEERERSSIAKVRIFIAENTQGNSK